jgi:hypothetical protein
MFLLPSIPVVLLVGGKEEEPLNLAHGSSTLVFELGVEEIAAADGGDVEACVLETFSSVSRGSFFLYSVAVCVIPRGFV